MTTEVVASTSLVKGWRHYLLWWCIWMGIGGLLQPVGSGDGDFWRFKLIQVTWGIGFGVVCSALFTLTQNTLNIQRKRYLTWLVAFVIWTAMKLVVAGLTGQLA